MRATRSKRPCRIQSGPGDQREPVGAVESTARLEPNEALIGCPDCAVPPAELAWLVGAGTSAAAGVPTAGQIVDDLLTRMYASAFDTVREKLDTADPAVMARIRSCFDGRNGMQPSGDPSDYSTAFRLALPDPNARLRYFRDLVRDRREVAGAVRRVPGRGFDR
jgi:hypothetical protein